MKPTRSSRTAAALGLLLILTAACNPQKALTKKRVASVERSLMRAVYLQGLSPEKLRLIERLAFYKVPAVSIAAIDKNALEWTRAYGERDTQTREPITTETLFQAGALSRIVAAAVALRLAERGELGLDEDAGTRLKSWHLPPEPGLDRRLFTLRRLLTNSAGLSDQVLSGYAPDGPCPTLLQVLDGKPPASNGPVWEPPRRALTQRAWPSESGYAVVEQILAENSGLPFAELAEREIFKVLGTSRSTFADPLPQGLEMTAAWGHLREEQVIPGRWRRYPAKAAKGLWTTPADFAGFLLDLCASAGGRDGGLLTPVMARTMLSPFVENYGFGFFADGGGDDINYHLTGKTQGYACAMVVYPARRQGVVVMTNSDNGDLLIEEILASFAEVYGWPHYKPEQKAVLRLEPESYRGLAGRYEVDANYGLDVSWEDYYLVIRPTGQAATKFYAEGRTLFYSTDPYIRIQFYKDDRGRTTGLSLWQKDFRIEARKTS
jgi:CubicO group peptidase (beta-lactamase class C family)